MRNGEGDVFRCMEIWAAKYMNFLNIESERVVFRRVSIFA